MEVSLQLVAAVTMLGGTILQCKANDLLPEEDRALFEKEPRSMTSRSAFRFSVILGIFLILTFIMSYLRARGIFQIPPFLLMTIAGVIIFLIWTPKHPKKVTKFKPSPRYLKYNRGAGTLFLVSTVAHFWKYSLLTHT